MEKDKIPITKELVIWQYKRSYFHRYSYTYIFTAVYLLLYAVSLGFLLKMSTHDIKIIGGIAMLSLVALFLVWQIIYLTLELVRVLRGQFHITTDKIVERNEPHKKKNRGAEPANFIFEKYGYYSLKKAYSHKDQKLISAYKQFTKAYLGDVYYVAILQKNESIIAVFNPEEYYFEKCE